MPPPEEAADHLMMSFEPVTPESVRYALGRLQQFKSPGSDGLPPSLLRTCAEELSDSLSEVFNESLETGVFPTAYKLASVTPVFKQNKDLANPADYRPVSLLPVVSKLLERIVLRRLLEHIRTNPDVNIIPEEQFAYRRRHSTEDLLSLAISTWQTEMDKGRASGAVFLDMTKAFDSVSHQKLLNTLFECGIRGTCLAWFASYLENRQQQVVLASTGQRSTLQHCLRGVPQGSVLGPILFSIYVRKLPKCVPPPTKCLIYADDICLTSSGDISAIRMNLQAAVDAVGTHLFELGLVLNPTKSQLTLWRHKKHQYFCCF